MLIDFLEDSAAWLREKKGAYRSLNRQYKKFYSRDLREEMALLKEEIKKKYHEINEALYEDLQELMLIKKYFPGLYREFLQDDGIGGIVKEKDWLLGRKKYGKGEAEEKMGRLKSARSQLRDAAVFLNKWPRQTIDARSLSATWPVLKGGIKGEPDKDDVLEFIKKKDGELRREGWLLLLNDSMIEATIGKFLKSVRSFKSDEELKASKFVQAKGKGSVKEFDALKELREAQQKRAHLERLCRHLLLANPGFLALLWKRRKWGGKSSDLESFAGKIALKSINEKEWLREMKKRLSE